MKKRTKLIIIIAVTAAVLAAAVTAFILVKNNKTPAPEPEKEEIKVKEQVTAEIMTDVLSAKDFFENLPEDKELQIKYSFDGQDVVFSEKYDKTGYFKVTLTDGETEYDSILCVKDTTPPVLVTKDLEIETETDFQEYILVESCTDNSGKDCTYSIKDAPDFSKPGEYNIILVATDESGNSTEAPVKITVKPREETPAEETPAETEKPSSGSASKPSAGSASKPSSGTASSNKPSSGTTSNKPSSGSSSSGTSSGKATFVKHDKETVTEETKYNYGMKVVTTTETKFDLYSDGSRRNVKKLVSKQNDYSGFSATTADMLPEAVQNMKTYSSEVNTVLDGTNRLRAETGANPLQLDETLTKAAMLRAVEMAYSGCFSHTRPDGRYFSFVLLDLGYSMIGCGENIAMGQTTAEKAVKSWKNSKGHYENIIYPNYTKTGVGVIKVAGGWWWVQLFA